MKMTPAHGVDTPQFEEVSGIQIDVSQVAVAMALSKLGWSSDERPVLHVNACNLIAARDVARAAGWAIDVVADPRIADWDTWFVEWHGSRVGSVGG